MPLWWVVMLVVVATGLAAVGVVGVMLAGFRRDVEEQRCLRAVITREDTRAMWEWVGDQFSAENNPQSANFVLALTRQLDERLPALKCESGIPVPIDE